MKNRRLKKVIKYYKSKPYQLFFRDIFYEGAIYKDGNRLGKRKVKLLQLELAHRLNGVLEKSFLTTEELDKLLKDK